MGRRRREITKVQLPDFLLSRKALEQLTDLFLEKRTALSAVGTNGFGPRVTDLEAALELLRRITGYTRSILGLREDPEPEPRIVLTHELEGLPRRTVKAYLVFVPLGVGLAAGAALVSPGPVAFVALGAGFVLLVIPYIVFRRIRLNIEHECSYLRDEAGQAAIVIDQLPRIQFQSYLAHEYAHHLYFPLKNHNGPKWMREGWARLLQWSVVEALSHSERDSAYTYHALCQIVGELKFACEVVAKTLEIKLPSEVRRARTPFHTNPLFCLVTGTPTFYAPDMLDHAVGTAAFFLAEKKFGSERALKEDLLSLFF